MPRERSSVQLPLRRKIATDDDWSAATLDRDEVLKVHVQITPGRLDDAVEVIEGTGGTVRHSFETAVIADLEAGKVQEVAESDAVRLVHEPPEKTPHRIVPDGYEADEEWELLGESLPQTEGLEVLQAANLHEAGVTGEGVTIAIFDALFDVNNEQYADQVVATLGAEPGDPLYAAYEFPGGHGDAVADIIASMAPDAELVLAEMFNVVDFEDALQTIQEDYPEVTVGNFSVGYAHVMRIDGEDEISQAIEEYFTEDGDRIFVNSAGNSARVDWAWMWNPEEEAPVPLDQGSEGDLWHGEFTDTTGNDLMEFEEILENPERLPISTGAPGAQEPVGWVNVHWDADVEADDQVYEARLYPTPDADEPLEDPETGEPIISQTENPWEVLDIWGSWFEDEDDRIYLEVENIDADGDQYFDVWAQFGAVNIPPIGGSLLEGGTPLGKNDRTIGIPSTSQDEDLVSAAAVQAVDVGPGEGETEVAFDLNAGDLKGYSSQGPTQDGRQGIDLAGSAHVSTNAFGPIEDVFGMNGTSAAAPHVAGATALLVSGLGGLDSGAVRSALADTGVGIADPDVDDPPNPQIGDGQVNALLAAVELDIIEPVGLQTQALDLTEGDTEVVVDVREAEADDWVVVTTVPEDPADPADYEGEAVVGKVQLESETVGQDVLVDIEGAGSGDYAAHIVTELSDATETTGEVSAATVANIEGTSDPAPVYEVAAFDWVDETSPSPVETVTVDEIEINYDGEIGEDHISIDLHEVEDGAPGAFIGISREDLAVNETHFAVEVDVVEPVTPEEVAAGDAVREEDYITRTDDFFAMAHLGPAAEGAEGGRVPAGQPPLVTTTSPGTVGDFATVTVADVSVQVQGSIDVPDRTLITDQDEHERFGSNQYTVTAIRTALEGEEIEVNVEAPADLEYNVEIFDRTLDRVDFESGLEGDASVDFDLSDYDSGTYLIAPVDAGTVLAVHPLVVEAYTPTITQAPDVIQTGGTLEVTAELDQHDSEPTLEDVVLGGFSESDDSGMLVTMEEVEANVYEAEVVDPPADEYQLHVAARSDEDVEFEIQGLTLEEETTTGDTSSLDDAEPQFIDSLSGPELLGLSEGHDLTVELDDGDVLVEGWSHDTNTLDSQTAGNLQFSRLGVHNENVVVGGLDEFVTVHARNSGQLRGDGDTPEDKAIQRYGSLSDSSPVIVDGTAYVGDGGGYLHAIDVDDVDVVWSANTADSPESDGSAVTSTAAYGDVEEFAGTDMVFFGANDGVVHGVSADDGAPFWSTDVGSPVHSELEFGWVEFNGDELPLLFVTTTGGDLVILDPLGALATPGDVLLSVGSDVTDTDDFGASSPVFEDNVLYVAGEGTVHAIDVEGTLLAGAPDFVWQADGFGNVGADPVISDDGGWVYIADARGDVNAHKTSDGSSIAVDVSSEPLASTPALADGRLVVGTLDGAVVVISGALDVVGSVSVGAPVLSEPVVRGDNIYVGTEAGTVFNFENIP